MFMRLCVRTHNHNLFLLSLPLHRVFPMALKGIRVIEFAGLAPAPFCGMLLAEYGASVVRVDKVSANAADFDGMDCMGSGKMSIAINLKNPEGIKIVRKMCKTSDVVLEPFRKGVMEKLGIGPNILLADNPRLVYARLTGYGQSGHYSSRAGHDINYLAISGLLSLLGRKDDKPMPPVNLVADFGGGGLMCALGIVMALLERERSGCGQVIDANMVEGAAYLGSWLYRSQHWPLWENPRGCNMLDTGSPFYDTYMTRDGKYMAVGAVEPKFRQELLQVLGIPESEAPLWEDLEETGKKFAKKFAEKTQEEWCKAFDGTDACVTPVLSLQEVAEHRHNAERGSFERFHDNGQMVPGPAPRLQRTPATSLARLHCPCVGEHTHNILHSLQYSTHDINLLHKEGVVHCHERGAKL